MGPETANFIVYLTTAEVLFKQKRGEVFLQIF